MMQFRALSQEANLRFSRFIRDLISSRHGLVIYEVQLLFNTFKSNMDSKSSGYTQSLVVNEIDYIMPLKHEIG